MAYIFHIAIFICFYTLLSQSLNLVAGKTGLVSLAHAAFYGIGAYTTALLSLQLGTSFWINLPVAIVVNGIIALLISLIALRTIEDYFIICTLGIQIIIFSLMNNWMGLTNGPLGIPGITHIHFFGINFDSKGSFLLLSIFFTAIVWWILRNISVSGFGKMLTAISEDEIYAQSIGKNVYMTKTMVFTLSAMLAAIPGTLYAHYITYIDPSSFTINESIFILSIVIIGGMDSLLGSFLATVFMISLPEILRFVGMPDSVAANFRQIIYGLILVILTMSGKTKISELFRVKNRSKIPERSI
ncbi:MAG TPA: branched-chain amino acid ABC transporter permease [Cytophagaceae bacterium]|jgi:branched-chain amino acid transport system permease protein|nr:branched-chain amino acid ABC transporter permease [Cytophagaceae bacterium]